MYDSELNFYKKNGWVKIKSFFKDQFIDLAKQNISEILAINHKKYSGRDINYAPNGEINSFHRLSEYSWPASIQSSRELTKLVSLLLEDEPEPRGAEFFAKPKGVGMASPDHQDNYYWCVEGGKALTVWIPLGAAGLKNGGVYYYDRSHLLGLLEHKPSNAPGSSQTIRYTDGLVLFNKSLPELLPGDILIHHSLCIHGSSKNQSVYDRPGWTMQFKARSAGYDESMKARYESELLAQVSRRQLA